MKISVPPLRLYRRPIAGPREPRAGFALVITLSLLALLVLLLVALTSLTRIETAVAGLTQAEIRARQNAQMALNLAIGELQRTAGPDRTVTTRSGLNPAAANPFWTEVWDVTNPAAPVRSGWLVNPGSAAAPNLDPTVGVLPVSAATVDLVGSATTLNPDQHIRLGKTPVRTTGLPGFAAGEERQVGAFAWWVSDEGVKASLAGGDTTTAFNYNDLPAATNYLASAVTDPGFINRRRIAQQTLPVHRLDHTFSAITGETLTAIDSSILAAAIHPGANDLRGRVQMTTQFFPALAAAQGATTAPLDPSLYVAPSIAPLDMNAAAQRTAMRDRQRLRFHDVTPMHHGVLANTFLGGLKVDVSTAALGNAFQTYAGLRPQAATNYTSQHDIVVGVDASDTAQVNAIAGQPLVTLAPILTEFQLDAAFGTVPGSPSTTAVTLTLTVELWNPYNTTLRVPPGLRIAIPRTALPDLQVTDGTSVRIASLANTLAPAPPPPDVPWTIPLSVAAWAPGAVQLVTVTFPNVPLRDTANNVIQGFDDTQPVLAHDANPAGAQLTVDLQINTVASTGFITAQRHASISYDPISPGDAASLLRYHYRMMDGEYFGAAGWLATFDPRAPVLPASVFIVDDAEPESAALSYATLVNANLPQSIVDPATIGYAPVVLFDVPRQEVLSVGAFQHVAISPPVGATVPAYVVGNPSSGLFNNLVYDGLFVGAVPRGAANDNYDLVNQRWAQTHLRPVTRALDGAPLPLNPLPTNPLLGRARSDRSAEFLLARNAFNVNSTSIAAWRAVLAGSLPGELAWDGGTQRLVGNWTWGATTGGTNNVFVENAFFRFPQTAQEINTHGGATYTDLKNALEGGGAAARRQAAYRIGVRELTPTQVEALAIRIVALLQTEIASRGVLRPFHSVGEFLDSGLLQQAIDTVTAAPVAGITPINDPGNIGTTIDRRAPGYLTQADIASLLAPLLQARSDTFLIRAYGEANNPALDPDDPRFVQGRAWCEALVQRLPMRVPRDPAGPPLDNMLPTDPAQDFGRQFRVIYFRWLTPSDI